jgi:hypothetical protein
MKDELQLLRAWENIVRRGRGRGLGMTMITQRSAVLNKNVLTQCQTLIAMRTTGPQDVAAIEAWLKYHQQGREILESLASLEDGEAWVWSPRFLKKTVRVRFRMRETFDSGATPKMSKETRKPATLADVDLKAVKLKMEATIERQKAEDPRALRARIAELERKVKAAPVPAAAKVGIKEIPVITDKQMKVFVSTVTMLEKAIRKYDDGHEKLSAAIFGIQQSISDFVGVALKNPIAVPTARLTISPHIPVSSAAHSLITTHATAKTLKTGSQGSPQDLIKGELKILGELAARSPAGYSRSQVGALTGYTPSGGTFGNYFSNLRRRGLIEERGGLVYITQAGIQQIGTNIPPAPTSHEELMAMWQRALVSGAYRMLEVIVATGNHGVGRLVLADAVGMTATGGTFGNYLSILRRNSLVAEQGGLLIATDILWP